MIVTSVGIVFFLMYQLVHTFGHAAVSVNWLIASLVMGCVMSVVMLGFMWSMYEGRRTKILVVIVACVLGVGLLWINRSQAAVEDAAFMKSMIPAAALDADHARGAS